MAASSRRKRQKKVKGALPAASGTVQPASKPWRVTQAARIRVSPKSMQWRLLMRAQALGQGTPPAWIPRVGEHIVVRGGTEVDTVHPLVRSILEHSDSPRARVAKGKWRTRKSYTVEVRELYPSRSPRWVRWGRGKTAGHMRWASLHDVHPVPTDLELLADVGKDWEGG